MELNLLNLVQNATTCNEAVVLMEEMIHQAINEIIPKVTPKNRRNKEWITKDIVTLHHQQCRAYKKWKKSGRIHLKSTYQSIQKKLKKASFITKKQSFLDAFSKCITPACFWQTIRRLNGKATKQTVPTLMSSQDEEVQNDTDKTELLKNQFSSVFNRITPQNVTSILPQDDPDLPVRTSNIKDVLKYINKLPNRKAMGNDGIAASVIKNCSLVLAPCLIRIADRIMEEG
jgi:hypothetical protein